MTRSVLVMSEVNENQPLGTPTWVTLRTPDVATAEEYYGHVFGWSFEDGTLGTLCLLRGVPVAGIEPGHGGWTVHLATDDCDATAKAVAAAGGTVTVAPHEVGDLGRAAFATDPTGAVFGAWQPGTHTGWDAVDEPGSVVWSEVMTHDQPAALEFYRRVYGYRAEDMSGPGFVYATVAVDGQTVAVSWWGMRSSTSGSSPPSDFRAMTAAQPTRTPATSAIR